MIVEHTFITTLEGDDAIKRISDFLFQRGFTVVPKSAFGLDAQTRTITLTRGRAKAAKAKSIDELPQEVRVEWDRGRVIVAASIEPHERSSFSMSSAHIKPDSPKLYVHRELLMVIATSLETLLSNQDLQMLEPRWKWMGELIEQDRLKRRRRRRIGWTLLILLLLSPIIITFLVILLDT